MAALGSSDLATARGAQARLRLDGDAVHGVHHTGTALRLATRRDNDRGAFSMRTAASGQRNQSRWQQGSLQNARRQHYKEMAGAIQPRLAQSLSQVRRKSCANTSECPGVQLSFLPPRANRRITSPTPETIGYALNIMVTRRISTYLLLLAPRGLACLNGGLDNVDRAADRLQAPVVLATAATDVRGMLR